MSMHTIFADRLGALKRCHSSMVAVPRPWVASTHDSLSETKMTKSPSAFRSFKTANGALQFVPPPPIDASLVALVMTVSRGFRAIFTTSCSNGSTSADGFLCTTAAATSAATSMHLTALVAPLRYPVIADDIDPETSGQ